MDLGLAEQFPVTIQFRAIPDERPYPPLYLRI